MHPPWHCIPLCFCLVSAARLSSPAGHRHAGMPGTAALQHCPAPFLRRPCGAAITPQSFGACLQHNADIGGQPCINCSVLCSVSGTNRHDSVPGMNRHDCAPGMNIMQRAWHEHTAPQPHQGPIWSTTNKRVPWTAAGAVSGATRSQKELAPVFAQTPIPVSSLLNF